MFSFRSILKLLALLVFVVPSSSVVAQQEEDNSTLMMGDDNNDSSLMKNYNAMRDEGQGLYLAEYSNLYEKPGSTPTPLVALSWLCDLEFLSDDAETNNYGFVGRAVMYLLGSNLEDQIAQGAQSFSTIKRALSVSAVMIPTLGIFEGQIHPAHDDWVNRFWDDGKTILARLGWEGHDKGDTHPNSDTSAFSASGTSTKISTEAAAELLGMEVADMTPATCSMEYEVALNATHVPDPIDTSVTDLEENVAQLQADNKELLSRIVAIEGSRKAPGSSSSGADVAATTEASLSLDIVMKPFLTVAVSIGLVLVL